MDETQRRTYWRRNLRLMAVLLTIWALVSFGAGIIFVLLIAFYVWRMDKLDAEFGIDEYEQEVHHS